MDLEIEGERIRDVGAVRGERMFRLPDPDRWFIEMHRRGTELLGLPVVDTLYVASPAYPQRSYHSPVKNYELVGGRNDPVEDCRLVLRVLGDYWRELGKREREHRGLVSIYRSCFDDSDAPGSEPGACAWESFQGKEETP